MKRPAHPSFLPARPWLSPTSASAPVWPASGAAAGRASVTGPRCVDIGNRLPASVSCSVVIGDDVVSLGGHFTACAFHSTRSDQPDAKVGNSFVGSSSRAMELHASLVGVDTVSVKVAGGSSQIGRHLMGAGDGAVSRGGNVIDRVELSMEAAVGLADADAGLAPAGGGWMEPGRFLANVGNRSASTGDHAVVLGCHALTNDQCRMASVGDFAASVSHLMEIGDFDGEGCLRRPPLSRPRPRLSRSRLRASCHFPPLGGDSFSVLTHGNSPTQKQPTKGKLSSHKSEPRSSFERKYG